MKYVYPAIFTPFDKGEGYTVEVPDLKGCVTEGESLSDAIEMGQDAACGWILGEIEDGNSFPPPSELGHVRVPDGSFASYLVLDLVKYAERFGGKAIRRNITIPAWLDTYAQQNGISLSKLAQECLFEYAQRNSAKRLYK